MTLDYHRQIVDQLDLALDKATATSSSITPGIGLTDARGVEHALLVPHLTATDLEAGLDVIRAAPADNGRVERIVRRPAVEEREVLDEGVLDPVAGLVGDNWRVRGSSTTDDGSADPDRQLTIMNVRAAALVARSDDRWHLAGDQFYVDLDISHDNLPAGTRLAIGSAVVEITEAPHRGCKKFAARFGPEALRVFNSPIGLTLRLRGANAKVIVAGTVRPGDPIRKLTT